MDVLAWLWWLVSTIVYWIWSIVWFLISGWVATLVQITLLIAAIFVFKYGWQRAPGEIWSRTQWIGKWVWNWLRATEQPQPAEAKVVEREVVRVVKVKQFADVNLSTLLSLTAFVGLILLAQIS